MMKHHNGRIRLAAALTLCALVLTLCLPALAAQTDRRIFDEAELFSESEESELMAAIQQLQASTGMDYVILTSRQAHDGADQQRIADDFYDKYAFGLDDEKSGVLIYIDMYERQVYLSTAGAMIDYLTDERIEGVLDAIAPQLTSRRYAAGAAAALNRIEQYYRAGIPEGQYRYDVITGERLTARHKALTAGEIGLGAVVGAVIALIVAGVVRGRYKLKGSTYSYSYAENSDMELTQDEDVYVRTTTTRTPKVQNNGGGGRGGFGGGSGGSGVHIGSSGSSHGGGGRGF